MNRKKVLILIVNSLSTGGKEGSFRLEREVDKELTEKEIKYKYIGHTFSYKTPDSSSTTYKVTDITEFYFLPDQYFVSPKVKKYGEKSKGFISLSCHDDLTFWSSKESKYVEGVKKSSHEFELSEDEGVIFNKIQHMYNGDPYVEIEFDFSWDKENYYFIEKSDERNPEDTIDTWEFPKIDWEVHFKPKDDTEYFEDKHIKYSTIYPSFLDKQL